MRYVQCTVFYQYCRQCRHWLIFYERLHRIHISCFHRRHCWDRNVDQRNWSPTLKKIFLFSEIFFYRDSSQTILRYDRHISFYVNKMFYFYHRHSLWKYFTFAYKVSFSKWYDMVCLTKHLFLLKQKTRAYDQPIY